METIELKRSPWETSSTTRKGHRRLSTSPWRSVESRPILPFRPTSLLRQLNGRSSMPTWRLMKRSRELSLKSKWRTRRIRDQSNRLLPLLRTPSTQSQWREHSRSWREWSSKMLMKRSLRITSTMKIQLKILEPPRSDQSYLFGDSQLREAGRSM